MAGTVSDNKDRRIDHSEAGLIYTSVGGGAGAGQELINFFQGTASTSRKVTSSADPGAGFTVEELNSPQFNPVRSNIDPPVPSPQQYDYDVFISNVVWMLKIYLSDGQDLTSFGLRARVSRNALASAEDDSILFDDGTLAHRYIGAYPSTQSWIIVPIDMKHFLEPGFPDGRGGFVTGAGFQYGTSDDTNIPTQIDRWGCTASVTAGGAKSENLFLDAVDFSDGLWIVGGTESPDDPATFQDFLDYDEGTIANRIGHATEADGIIYYFGTLAIGRTSVNSSPSDVALPTYFSDENRVVVWPLHRAYPGWNRALIDLTDPATQVIWTNCVHTSLGIGRRTLDFGATHDVDATNDRVNVGVEGHWQDGDTVEYRVEHILDSPIDNIGLNTDNYATNLGQDRFYHVAENAPGEYSFYRMAFDGGSLDHWFDALTDNRQGTLRQLTAATSSPEQRHKLKFYNDERPDLRVVSGVSPAGSFLIDGGTYENWRWWILTAETTVSGASVIGISFIQQNSAVFDGAIFIDPVIIPLEENKAMMDCDDPSKLSNSIFNYLSDSSNIGHALRITVPGTYTFAGNTFPGAWGADDSDNAMILNDSGGLVTLNITGGGDTPTVKNAANSPENVTVINNNVNVTITNLQVNTEVRVYPAEDFNSPIITTQIAGIEDVGSPTEFSFSSAAGTIVDIVIHNVNYVLPPNNRIKNFTVPTTDTSFPVTQLLDVNFRNP